MLRLRTLMLLAPIAMIGCVGKPKQLPLHPPILRPAPPPLPPQPALGWTDRPLTPGFWSYARDARGGLALFGLAGADATLTIRCDVATRRMFVSRPGSVAGRMTLRATTGLRTYDARPTGALPPYVAAELAATDRQLDALAFSRGRFLIALDGANDLIMPSGPEVARVIEDCRG